ncbi:methyltransferase [Neohortaea acidophila]|uniref:Methyltransferase n=1 Tax=Neohortaea acidophila TaxID=245834 RepID=A0A6A6Q050_9PEZI|nr:methyltransferase [Neohortaea acidophila]KAF2485848.1 methyltransferase [Neohortaea acidophila]
MAKDHWSSAAYNSAANFVPQLTSKVVAYLDVQPTDHILDLGCGDGTLTYQLAAAAPQGRVLGLDNSASFISTAQEKHTTPNSTYRHVDCSKLSSCPDAIDGSWDKVFSNAAMHWILRDPSIRHPFFADVHKALKPGGKFVFEQGGAGNVAEAHAAAISALIHAGVPVAEAYEASPWFFPSPDWMRGALEKAGFEVEVCELEYRPTKLTAESGGSGAGLEGWVRLMCAQFLDAVEDGKRDAVAREICTVLEPVVTRGEDGSRWMGYCRLRAVARKKA